MPTAEKIIRAVAAGETLYGVTKMLEAEGIPTPNGSKNWNRIFIRKMIRDDAYLPHTHDEIKALGVAPEVAATLDPNDRYGIVWHNRTQTKIVEKVKTGPEQYRYKRRVIERPPKDWIAVPIPAPPGLDRETVERARAQISGNVRPSRERACGSYPEGCCSAAIAGVVCAGITHRPGARAASSVRSFTTSAPARFTRTSPRASNAIIAPNPSKSTL